MLGLLAIVIIGAGGMIYFGNFLMKKNSNSLINTKLGNVGADAQEQTYLKARKDLEKYSGLNATIQNVLPKDKDQAAAVAELYSIGDETGITIDKIIFPSSTLGQKSTATTASTTVGATASPTVTQAVTIPGIPGVLGIDVTIDLKPASGKSISYDNMISFLQKVELNRRSMQIKNISVQSDTTNGGVTFNATLTIFVKP
jgi:hypothetical protein